MANRKAFKEMDNRRLVDFAKALVNSMRLKEVDLLECLSVIRARKLHVMAGCPNLAAFCEEHLGLTADQAWKRSQVVNAVTFFPELLTMFKEGRTHLCQMQMVAKQITPANSDMILGFMPGKSKRELEAFLSQVSPEGEFVNREPQVEITLKLPVRVVQKLERAHGLMLKGPESVGRAEVIEAALDALLDRKDPVRKANRAKDRREKKKNRKEVSNEAKVQESRKSPVRKRYIPAKIRHTVHQSELPRCSFVSKAGHQCREAANLQIDHKKMWSKGGSHDPKNLRLMCPAHNRYLAELEMGKRMH